MADKKGLIEELAALTGCTYMSDLHLSSRRAQVVRAAEGIEPGRYSTADWCEAYSYVMGKRLSMRSTATEEEARHGFIEKLRAKE